MLSCKLGDYKLPRAIEPTVVPQFQVCIMLWLRPFKYLCGVILIESFFFCFTLQRTRNSLQQKSDKLSKKTVIFGLTRGETGEILGDTVCFATRGCERVGVREEYVCACV